MTVFSTGDASRYRGAIWSNNSLLDRKLMYDLTFLPSACIQLWVTLLVRQAPVKSKIYRESIRELLTIGRGQSLPPIDSLAGIGWGGAVLGERLDMGYRPPHAVKLGLAAGAQPR